MAKGIHWDFYESFKRKYPRTFTKLTVTLNQDVTNRVLRGESYMLAQDLASKLVVDDYQFEKPIPENILHSLAGMDLYKIMSSLSGWHFEKTQLNGKDFTQSIYFKGNGRVSNDGE